MISIWGCSSFVINLSYDSSRRTWAAKPGGGGKMTFCLVFLMGGILRTLSPPPPESAATGKVIGNKQVDW